MQGWINVDIQSCFKLKSGESLTSRNMVDGPYKVYGGNGVAGKHNRHNLESKHVIVGRVGALCGNVRYIDENIWLTDNAFKLTDFKYNFDLEFLTYYLNSLNLKQYARQAAQPVISNSSLKSVSLNFPSNVEEQKQIVAILDEAFEGIDKAIVNTEKNLVNARELFESHLNNIFTQKGEGWEEKPLVEITSKLGDGLHGTPIYTEDGEYCFINGNNLNNGVIEFKERTKRVSMDEYNKYKKELNNRTVLVSINGTLGKVAFYDNEKVILGKSACYFNLHDFVDKDYIKYIICSPYFIKYAQREATGATIKNVSLKTMRNFMVPLPSENEQKEISRNLNAIENNTISLINVQNRKLAALNELKQSLLQKAFRGELTSARATTEVKQAISA
jgi:type I restriction enzyme S subunit